MTRVHVAKLICQPLFDKVGSRSMGNIVSNNSEKKNIYIKTCH